MFYHQPLQPQNHYPVWDSGEDEVGPAVQATYQASTYSMSRSPIRSKLISYLHVPHEYHPSTVKDE